MKIVDYQLDKLVFPRSRAIGDATLGAKTSDFEAAYLRLRTDTGIEGIGIDSADGSLSEIQTKFERSWHQLESKNLAALIHTHPRNRGWSFSPGRYTSMQTDRLVDFALWDLYGKHFDMPVYELMGGEDPKVPAYASGLAFIHDDETTRGIYEKFAEMGFTNAKVKVGFPTVEEDIARLRLVEETLGKDGKLMIDANEKFSPKEAIRRAHAYRDAGIDVFWFEDPVLRTDVDGLARISAEVPFTHVNAGEYVGFEAKCELLECGAADVLNTHSFTAARRAATVAGAHGIPVSLGNTPGNLGVHVAAALPEAIFVEYSMTEREQILEKPIKMRDDTAIAPDRAGHGLAISETTVERYAVDR